MKRLQLVTFYHAEMADGDPDWGAEMVEREDGPYCLFSEANALIGELRKRLEEANNELYRAKSAGWDPRYPYSERRTHGP